MGVFSSLSVVWLLLPYLAAVSVVAAFLSWLIATPTINLRLTSRPSLFTIRCRFANR
jgi:hypothetical protein